MSQQQSEPLLTEDEKQRLSPGVTFVVIMAAVFATNFQPVWVALLVVFLATALMKRLLPTPTRGQKALGLVVGFGILLIGVLVDPQMTPNGIFVAGMVFVSLSPLARRKHSA